MKSRYFYLIFFILFADTSLSTVNAQNPNFHFQLNKSGNWCFYNSNKRLCISNDYNLVSVEKNSINFETHEEYISTSFFQGFVNFHFKSLEERKSECFKIKKPFKLIETKEFYGFKTTYFNLKGKSNNSFGMFYMELNNSCLLITPKYNSTWEQLSKIILIERTHNIDTH